MDVMCLLFLIGLCIIAYDQKADQEERVSRFAMLELPGGCLATTRRGADRTPAPPDVAALSRRRRCWRAGDARGNAAYAVARF